MTSIPQNPAELADIGVHIIEVPTPFIVGPVNCVLVEGSPLTLFDTGTSTDESWEALEAGIQRLGYEIRDIERVILTHHHADHTGLLRRIVDLSGAVVFGHPQLERQAVLSHEHNEAQRQFFMHIMAEFGVPEETAEGAMQLWAAFKAFTEPVHVDHSIAHDGAVGPYRVHFVPGHSATDTLFVHETEGYTIAGDHLLQIFNPNPLIRRPEPGVVRPQTLIEYQASLRYSRDLDLGYVVPGHGAPFTEHVAVVDGLLEQHDKRNARLKKALRNGPMTPYEAAKYLYPQIAVPNLYLALSVAIGQLELMEATGALQSARHEGILSYSMV